MPMADDERSPKPASDGRSPEQSVRSAVLAALGRTPEVLRVIVRPLWKDHFRVNVFVGADAASASIAHSYFVQVGEAGDITSASPPLPARMVRPRC
jgi:hypothetical protein